MVYYKTDQEIELMRESNLLVSKTLAEIAKQIKPGISTKKIDKIAEEFIRDNGAKPGFLGYQEFPNTLCISVNNQVIHGLPSSYELKEGDIVSVDCGVYKNGFYGDSAYTFTIGEIDSKVSKLLEVTKEALYIGIQQAVEGNRVGDISYAIQQYAKNYGYSVVREFVGHGVGKSLHEEPKVPNYGKRGKGKKLKKGIVLAIEPMINMGSKNIVKSKDGWTMSTADGMPSAHFEHSIAINKNKPDILSTFQYIEEVLNNLSP